MPTSTLELSRGSLRRLRQIDDELALMRSRIGGQGTGLSPKIDHSIILDVMRSVDECIDYEDELPRERRLCEHDIEMGWVVVFGAEELLEEEEMNKGMRDAIVRALAMRYLYDKDWGDIPRLVNYDGMSGKDVCDAVLSWMERRGLAHMKAAARRASGRQTDDVRGDSD